MEESLSDKMPASSKPETAVSFDDEVKFVIDWSIPNASSIKTQITETYSEKVVIGTSAWAIELVPAACFTRRTDGEERIMLSVVYDPLTAETAVAQTSAHTKFKVLDGDDQVQLKLKCLNNNGAIFLKHTDIWGPKPKYPPTGDTLRLRAEISYKAPRQAVPCEQLSTARLQNKLRLVLESDAGKDFILVSSEGVEQRVHRVMLEASSPVFRAMFQFSMEESKSGRCEVRDLSEATLEFLIRYMYYDSTEDLQDREMACRVLLAADKYQMDELKDTCQRVLIGKVRNNSAAAMLVLADKVSALCLKKACLRHIAGHLKSMEKAGHTKILFDEGDTELLREVFAAVAGTQVDHS